MSTLIDSAVPEAPADIRFYGVAIAEVVSNTDSMGLGRVQLRQSPVDDDEVGVAKLRGALMLLPVREAPANDLFHGAHVVVAEYLFHVEVSVVTLYRQGVFENHQGTDVVRALQVAHVETFDAIGRLLQGKCGAEFL